MEEMRSETRKLSQETQPKFRALEEDYRDKVREVLTDEQRTRYDEFRERRNAERRERRDGNRGQEQKRN
jgi:hypothetical protein